jgi:hypothetical protein
MAMNKTQVKPWVLLKILEEFLLLETYGGGVHQKKRTPLLECVTQSIY